MLLYTQMCLILFGDAIILLSHGNLNNITDRYENCLEQQFRVL